MVISRNYYKITKGKQCEWLEHAWRQTQLDLHCLWPGFHTEEYPFWAFSVFRLHLFAILNFGIVFAPLHHDRHIFPRTVAAVLMLKRSETSLSVSLGFSPVYWNFLGDWSCGSPKPNHLNMSPKKTIAVILEIPKDKGTDIYITHSNQACWDRRRWRPSHCLCLWC